MNSGVEVALKPDNKNLVILGMHRSGTSLIAGLLARCVWYVGTDEPYDPSFLEVLERLIHEMDMVP